MSEVDMDFYALAKEGVLSDDAPSYGIYEELNNEVVESAQVKSGIQVDIKHCADKFNSESAKSDEHKLCEKFERNLRKISKMEDKGIRKDKCLHFIYWIYEEARKIINKGNQKFTNADFISKFRDVQTKIYEEGKKEYYCKIYFDDTLDKWKEQKVLHDYFRNYDKINLKESSDRGKCQKYNQYIDFIRKMYDKHAKQEKECCKDYHIHYWDHCDYFKCHDIYNPNKIILKRNCGNKQASADPEAEGFAKSIKEVDSNIFLLENSMIVKPAKCVKTYNATKHHEGYSCLLPEYPEQKKTNTTNRDSPKKVDLGKYISVIDMSSYKNVSEIKIEDSKNQYNFDRPTSEMMTLFNEVPRDVRKAYRKRKHLECSYDKNGKTILCKIPDNPIPEEPERIPIITTVKGSIYDSDLGMEADVLENNYTRIAVVFILALGALLIFFIYYKFTPFGSWIRNRRRGKKNVEETYIKHKQRLPYREFEHEEVPTQRKRIRVAYQGA
ncbi:PIR protein [Plasmodium vivax]|uniref:VIR protein n=1 Tax=Plasmodium vivax TaxID=5855 RepID=A0A564ZQN8_PLAVI|nr:PIR protein [Plasmodium vivax]